MTISNVSRIEKNERKQEDRRKNLRIFYYPERRSGFDRRKTAHRSYFSKLVLYIRDNFLYFIVLLLTINLLNLLDLNMTLYSLSKGAKEINPVMKYLFEHDLLLAVFYKIAVGAAVTALFWRYRHYRLVLKTAIFTFNIYALLFIYHIVGIVFWL